MFLPTPKSRRALPLSAAPHRFVPLLSLLALLAALLGGCRDSDAGHWVGDMVTDNDFEAARGWGADPNGLTREHAHSGQFATFVSPAREFGLTFDVALHEASVHALKGVAVEAWAYLPSPQATASLNVEVRLPGPEGKLAFAGALALPDQVRENARWTRVRQEFALPAGLPADARLRIFLWRGGSQQPVYLDDLRVKALE